MTASSPRVVVITGGGGFIGSHLVERAMSRWPDASIRVVDNFSTGRRSNLAHLQDSPRLTIVQQSVLHRLSLESALDGADVAFHLAALPSVPRSVAHPIENDLNNVNGTVALLDVAVKHKVPRVVFAASSSVYGHGDGDRPRKETDALSPLSPYAASKLAGENYMHAFHATHGLTTVSLRFFNVFGARQNPRSTYAAVIPRFVQALLEGSKPIVYGDGEQRRDFTPVENVTKALMLAAEAPADKVAGRVMNVALGGSRSVLECLADIQRILGTNVEPKLEAERPGEVRYSLADISLARELLGYEPTIDWATGLRQTVEAQRTAWEIEMENVSGATPIRI